jgi:transcriptional regulator with XRE-family HTH domain
VIGGELVREARKRAGLTQAELAARAGTTQSAIARLESGRTTPALEQVERLLRLCGFQLVVSLAPYDDSDIVQAEARLRRTPDERIAELEAGLRSARELQEAVAAARRG